MLDANYLLGTSDWVGAQDAPQLSGTAAGFWRWDFPTSKYLPYPTHAAAGNRTTG